MDTSTLLYHNVFCNEKNIDFLEYQQGCREFTGLCNGNRWAYFVNNEYILFYNLLDEIIVGSHPLGDSIKQVRVIQNYVIIILQQSNKLFVYDCKRDFFRQFDLEIQPSLLSLPSIDDSTITCAIICYPFNVFGCKLSMHRNCFQHEIWDISLDSFKEEIDPRLTEYQRKTIVTANHLPSFPHVKTSINGSPPHEIKCPLTIDKICYFDYSNEIITIGGIDGLFVRYQVTSKQLILSASCITPEISSIKSTQTSSTTLGIVTQYSTSIQDCTHLVFYRYNQSGVSFHKVFVFKQCEFIAFHPRYNIQNEMIFVLIVHNVRDQNIECSVFTSDGDEIYVSSVCDSCQYYGMILDSRYDDDSSTMVDHFFNRLLPNSNELYLPKITEISQTIPLPPLILPLNEEFISRVLSLLFDFNHFGQYLKLIQKQPNAVNTSTLRLVNSILERQYTTFFNNNVYPTLKNDLSIVSSDNFIIMKTKVELCFKFFKLIHNPLETKLELHSQCLNFASLLFPFFKILSYSLQDRVNPVMINAILKERIQYNISFHSLTYYYIV
ncbi:Ribosome control protein 1 domain-containing protein [Entamoeba marina]